MAILLLISNVLSIGDYLAVLGLLYVIFVVFPLLLLQKLNNRAIL